MSLLMEYLILLSDWCDIFLLLGRDERRSIMRCAFLSIVIMGVLLLVAHSYRLYRIGAEMVASAAMVP